MREYNNWLGNNLVFGRIGARILHFSVEVSEVVELTTRSIFEKRSMLLNNSFGFRKGLTQRKFRNFRNRSVLEGDSIYLDAKLEKCVSSINIRVFTLQIQHFTHWNQCIYISNSTNQHELMIIFGATRFETELNFFSQPNLT